MALHTRRRALPAPVAEALERATGDTAGGRWLSTNATLAVILIWVLAVIVGTPWTAWRISRFLSHERWSFEDTLKLLPVALTLAAVWTALFVTWRNLGRNGWAVTPYGLAEVRGQAVSLHPWDTLGDAGAKAGALPQAVYDPSTGRVGVTTTESERLARRVSGEPAFQAIGGGTSGATWVRVPSAGGAPLELFFPRGSGDLPARFVERMNEAREAALPLPATVAGRGAPLSAGRAWGVGVAACFALGLFGSEPLLMPLHDTLLHETWAVPALFGGRTPAKEHLVDGQLGAYLRVFPDGPWAAMARERLDARNREQQAQPRDAAGQNAQPEAGPRGVAP